MHLCDICKNFQCMCGTGIVIIYDVLPVSFDFYVFLLAFYYIVCFWMYIIHVVCEVHCGHDR